MLGAKPGMMIAATRSTMSTSRANGPTQSSEDSAGRTPRRLTAPKLGLKPTTPQHAAGTRTEPPVSVPIAATAAPLATAAADPLDDPPGT
jgi:hypothetical protein